MSFPAQSHHFSYPLGWPLCGKPKRSCCIFAANMALLSRALLIHWVASKLCSPLPKQLIKQCMPMFPPQWALYVHHSSQSTRDGDPDLQGIKSRSSQCQWQVEADAWSAISRTPPTTFLPILLLRLFLSTCSGPKVSSLAENQDCSVKFWFYLFWHQQMGYFLTRPRCNHKLHAELCAFLFFNQVSDFAFSSKENEHCWFQLSEIYFFFPALRLQFSLC